MEPGGGLAQGGGALFDGGVGPNPTSPPIHKELMNNYLQVFVGVATNEVRLMAPPWVETSRQFSVSPNAL